MADVKIEVRENGPNRVSGPIEIVDMSGANYSIPEGRWVSLCRCRTLVGKALLRRRTPRRRLPGGFAGPLTGFAYPAIATRGRLKGRPYAIGKRNKH